MPHIWQNIQNPLDVGGTIIRDHPEMLSIPLQKQKIGLYLMYSNSFSRSYTHKKLSLNP